MESKSPASPPLLSRGISRRDWIRSAAAAGLAGRFVGRINAQQPGDRPPPAKGVRVVNPRDRVPVSLIIDDSTCLVNLAHFAIPQFAEVFPDNYKQPWRNLPREIPDAFVRSFGTWCAENGVMGKYSIVPYPACVGWLDRDLPGWSRRELEESLDLVRTLMLPGWDIHPEMISHTWAIDTKTGRPYPERSERFMENWGFSVGKSADELTDYLAYALRILRNVGLPCEGITTPGGFGTRVLGPLAEATLASCRDVFSAEIPHYFRHLYTDETSVAPRVELAAGLDGNDPRCVVSIIGCTGDWFGGWDGLEAGSVDQFITADGRGGRLPEILARGEPAVMVGHWPGFYFNGEEVGFRILKGIVARLREHYPDVIWMKLSEIARYWAAKELTRIERGGAALSLRAPFACPGLTIAVDGALEARPTLHAGNARTTLDEVKTRRDLRPGTFQRAGAGWLACFDLPRGESRLEWGVTQARS